MSIPMEPCSAQRSGSVSPIIKRRLSIELSKVLLLEDEDNELGNELQQKKMITKDFNKGFEQRISIKELESPINIQHILESRLDLESMQGSSPPEKRVKRMRDHFLDTHDTKLKLNFGGGDDLISGDILLFSPEKSDKFYESKVQNLLQNMQAPNPKIGLTGPTETKADRVAPEARLIGRKVLKFTDKILQKLETEQKAIEYGPPINPRDRVFWEDYQDESNTTNGVTLNGLDNELDVINDLKHEDTLSHSSSVEKLNFSESKSTNDSRPPSASKESFSSSSPMLSFPDLTNNVVSSFPDLNNDVSVGNLGFYSYTTIRQNDQNPFQKNGGVSCSQEKSLKNCQMKKASSQLNATSTSQPTSQSRSNSEPKSNSQPLPTSQPSSSSSSILDKEDQYASTRKKGTTIKSTETGDKKTDSNLNFDVSVDKKKKKTIPRYEKRYARRSSITKRFDALDLADGE